MLPAAEKRPLLMRRQSQETSSAQRFVTVADVDHTVVTVVMREPPEPRIQPAQFHCVGKQVVDPAPVRNRAMVRVMANIHHDEESRKPVRDEVEREESS